MESIEEIERKEQQRLAKSMINKVDSPSTYAEPVRVHQFTIPKENRSLNRQLVFAKSNIKKDNRYGLSPNEQFEVISWNPFVIRSLDSGRTIEQPDPSLFTS